MRTVRNAEMLAGVLANVLLLAGLLAAQGSQPRIQALGESSGNACV